MTHSYNRESIVPLHKRSQEGQTLILALLAMIVLIMAIIFLFDLQTVVRTKVKSQNAVDAAALAAADWQRQSLNLIGEMNLVKACTVLISDIPSPHSVPPSFLENEIDLETVQAASNLLTEMQVRVSFVGPLIALGAAQQAAKNNGLNYNVEFGAVAHKHYLRLISDELYTNDEFMAQNIRGYQWRQPYANMLFDVLDYSNGVPKGFAVAPNTSFMGMPSLTSDPPDFIGYLQQEWIYAAIHADYWCALKDLIKMDFGTGTNKWWGDIELIVDTTSFPQESEYLTLGIDFFDGSFAYYQAASVDAFAKILEESARKDLKLLREQYDPYNPDHVNDIDNKFDPLPAITWATYAENWGYYSAGTIDDWSKYLHSDFKEGMTYYGAVAKMWTMTEQTPLSGGWGEDTVVGDGSGEEKYLGDALKFGGDDSGGQLFNANAQRIKDVEKNMQQQALEPVEASALAKPLGRIETSEGRFLPPNIAGMVLPVFKSTTIIPLALENPGEFDPFDYKWYAFLTEYLPTLGTTGNLDAMPELMASRYADHWNKGWFTSYHAALVKLNDPAWRARGIKWLETEHTRDIYDEHGNVIDQETYVNEDTCDYWPPSGTEPRDGPGILH